MQRIVFEPTLIGENTYTRGDRKYAVKDLIKISQGLEPFDLPIIGIDLSVAPWSNTTDFLSICKHFKRTLVVDEKYPIILDDTGFICDGWHRLAKAIINEQETIKAVRLFTMPEPIV